MFYHDEIKVIGYTEGYTDDYGLWHEGTETIIKTIPCDIQPITRELAYKVFGYKDTVKYRIFADIDSNLDTGVIIKIGDEKYKIVSLLPWDDYVDMLVNDNG